MTRRWFPLLALALPLFTGCPSEGDDDDSFGPPDDDDVADTCEEDQDCRDFDDGLEICSDDGLCIEGDRNNAREEAQLLPYGTETDLVIAPAGDVDWFRFNGTEGDLVLIRVDAEDEDELDPVVIYMDDQGNQIGFNDDFDRIGTTNARLYVGVPSTGTFYISVQDKRSWVGDPNDPPEGGEDFGYTVRIDSAGGTSNVPVVDEPNEVFGDALLWNVEAYSTNYTLGGAFETAGDVDWLRVPVIAGEILRLYAFPNTGTAARPEVTVMLEDATTPIRSYTGLGWTAADRGYVPVLEDGFYYLQLEDVNGTGGFDHWYYLHAAKDEPDPEFRAETEPNDETAEDLGFVAGSSGEVTFYGRIGGAGDLDTFRIPSDATGRVTVRFAATGHGENTNPVVTLLAPSGTEVASGAWDGVDDSTALALEPIDESGDWTLVISEADPLAGDGGRYYLATVSVSP